LDVIDRDHQRIGLGRTLEPILELSQQPVALVQRAAEPAQHVGVDRWTLRVDQRVEQRRQRHRLVRDRGGAVIDAVAALATLRQHGLQQRALAQPGRASDQDDAATAVAEIVEPARQQRQLGGTTTKP
jgi:hypothetical protein